ncbi:GTPase-activating protein [Pyrenophora tritici-repentis]|nr:GTPase-activating protein [Pyrenophora tritici-repentis]PWO27242.1 HrpA, HrpA helicase [Pyrenophora tritici-repentis]PZD05412.1 GTPase-activating protein [Pyrenophora tritici-repentis]
MASALNKRQQARNERTLQDLIKTVPGNGTCADCGARNPGWASWSLGIFLCMRCAAIHRKLGTHISKVKSLSMDKWDNAQVDNMKRIGNVESNKTYNPRNVKPQIPIDIDEVDSAMERYIRAKYEQRIYLNDSRPGTRQNTGSTSSEDRPPPLPPKPTGRFGFGLRKAATSSRDITPPISPGLGDFGQHSPPRVNKPSRVFGSNVYTSGDGMDSKLATLRDMGFPDEKRNSTVLKGLNGNLDRAVEALIRLGEQSAAKSRGSTPTPPTKPAANGLSFDQASTTAGASSTNPFDALDARQQQQAQFDQQQAQQSYSSNSYNPFLQQAPQGYTQQQNPWDQQQHNLEQSFQGMQLSNPQPQQPLFPNRTGGYGQTQPSSYAQANPYHQSFTPPPMPQIPEQYSAFFAQPQPQYQTMSSPSSPGNPFLRSSRSQEPQQNYQTQQQNFQNQQQLYQQQSSNPFEKNAAILSLYSQPQMAPQQPEQQQAAPATSMPPAQAPGRSNPFANLSGAPQVVPTALGQLQGVPNLATVSQPDGATAKTTAASSAPESSQAATSQAVTSTSTANQAATTSVFNLVGAPTLAGVGIPEIKVPDTAAAPFMQKSNLPDGTVFICVGAILAFFGAAVLVWRSLVAWSLHRSVKRAAIAQNMADIKSMSTVPGKKRGMYNVVGANSTMSLDHLNAAPIGKSSKTFAGAPAQRSQSSLFFSPTAGGATGVRESMANRSSTYLPAGYYASGNSAPAAGSPQMHVGGQNPNNLSALSLNTPGNRFSTRSAISPPESPSLPPSRGGYSRAPPSRDGLPMYNRNSVATLGQPGNTRSMYGNAHESASQLSLNVPGGSNVPGGRTPSGYLEDLFENHGSGSRDRF